MQINTGRDFVSLIEQALNAEWPGLVDEEGGKLAKQWKDRVVQTIEMQEQVWTALQPAYLRWKIRNGRDPRMLISSRAMLSSFKSERIDQDTWRIGPGKGRHPEANVTFEYLSAIHEYGWGNNPPRPHWTPVFQEMQEKQPQVAEEFLAKLVDKVRDRIVSTI